MAERLHKKPLINFLTILIMFPWLVLLILSGDAIGHTTSFDEYFLLITPDARGCGLANGGGAFAHGASAAYYNPANLATINKCDIEFSYINPETHDERYKIFDYRIGANIGKWGYWGIAFYNDSWDYTYYLFDYTTRGKINHKIVNLNMAYSINPHISLGTGVKYIYNHFKESYSLFSSWGYTRQSIALDIGINISNIFPNFTLMKNEYMMEKPGIVNSHKGVSLGLSFANIGPIARKTENSDKPHLPQRMRISTGYQMINTDNIGLQLTLDATTFLIDIRDYHNQKLDKTAWHYGINIAVARLIQMRFGRRLNYLDDDKSIGLGISTEVRGFSAGIAANGDVDYVLTISYRL